jgi:hypothetical protein
MLTSNVNSTITNYRNAKQMTKIDIIYAFTRLLIYANSHYLIAFKIY